MIARAEQGDDAPWRTQYIRRTPLYEADVPTVSRRDFARFLALSGSATLLPSTVFAERRPRSIEELGFSARPLPPTPAEPDEKFWGEVRSRFLVPRDVAFLNAANLCPMSLPVVEAIERNMRGYEITPSPEVRSKLIHAREDARTMLAEALRVTPEEIVLTRNTTEGNNFVSSGLTLGPGDEVVVSTDNHPSNLAAWQKKGARFGFTVIASTTSRWSISSARARTGCLPSRVSWASAPTGCNSNR